MVYLLNYGEFRNDASGEVINAGLFFSEDGATFTNDGTVVNNGDLYSVGALANRGQLVNAATLVNSGTLSDTGGGLRNLGTLDNEGRMTLDQAGRTGMQQESGATVFNSGTFIVEADSALLNAPQQVGTGFTQSAGLTRVDGLLSADLVQIEGGTLSGTGLVAAGAIQIGDQAQVAPGESPGTMRFAGDTAFAGTLTIEINGTQLGQFDLLDATGFDVDFLAGATIAFDFGYLPSVGERFLFLAGSVTGLEQVRIQVSAPGDSLRYALYQTEAGVGIVAVSLPAPFALLVVGFPAFYLRRPRVARPRPCSGAPRPS